MTMCSEALHVPLSVPSAGRTMASSVRPIADRLRLAARHLARGVTPRSHRLYREQFGVGGAHALAEAHGADLIAWSAIGMWGVRRANSMELQVTLEGSEEAFWGNVEINESLVLSLAQHERHSANELLSTLTRDEVAELLPYILDRHGPGTRKSVLRDPSDAVSRRAKKESGVFYTPSDLADYMVSIADAGPDARTIDPACGTGVFLLSMLRRRASAADPSLVLSRLYGVDTDPFAVQASAFVLAAECLRLRPQDAAVLFWRTARRNLAVADALLLPSLRRALRGDQVQSPATLSAAQVTLDVMHKRGGAALTGPLSSALAEGFESVVANPPYAPLGVRDDFELLGQDFVTLTAPMPTRATNAFMPFVELMWAIASDQSRSCMVVPMSLAYSSDARIRRLREAIQSGPGEWTFRFFDRTPDAIFGDDVKQRVAIVSRDSLRRAPTIRTSGLRRWSSRERPQLFSQMAEPVEINHLGIADGIPKLGTRQEAAWYSTLRTRTRDLTQLPRAATQDADSSTVAIGRTAYNWVVLYRDLPDRGQATSCEYLRTMSPQVADWLYAVLASRLTYWLWRVEGDGFHVPMSFIEHLPYEWTDSDTDTSLASAGRRLWREALAFPVRSVNAGRTTTSYRTTDLPSLNVIDSLLVNKLGLPNEAATWVADYAHRTKVAGRAREGL